MRFELDKIQRIALEGQHSHAVEVAVITIRFGFSSTYGYDDHVVTIARRHSPYALAPVHVELAHEIGHAMTSLRAPYEIYESKDGRAYGELEAWVWALQRNPALAKHHRVILSCLRTYGAHRRMSTLYKAFACKLRELAS